MDSIEAEELLKKYGPNRLAEQKHVRFLLRLLSKLQSPLILLLLFAGFISAILGQISDFVIYVVITLVSSLLDAYQEHQAVGAVEKLRKRVSLTATVLRDGIKKEIPLADIVPGDTVYLSVGDIVPADCTIFSARDLLIDESTLTGESFPQEKAVNKSAFMGTNVVTGEGSAIVTVTGQHTELGKISGYLVAPRPPTEFERGINDFGILLMRTALFVGVSVFGIHLLLAHNLFSSLLFVLALAIGFAPELLPMIITINLSRGAMRMSRRGVIVKRLASIENFGSMDTLVTDKTGTLTENKIILEKYEGLDGKSSEKVLAYGYIGSVFQSGFRGPMEEAVLTHKEVGRQGFTRVDFIPFDFFRKRVSVIVNNKNERLLITKGAPEDLLKISRLTEAQRKKANTQLTSYGKQGFRVLGVAFKKLTTLKKSYEPSDEKDLTLIGFMVFLDPPKKTVTEALRRMESHGVGIKILTGDSDVVTSYICQKIGLPVNGLAGSDEVARCSDSELKDLVEKTTIFYRMNPDQKVRVITALRAHGRVVGYMGDGINDAPSLRAADIGISVNNATDVAKLSADIILLHKDLHVLLDGVREGRITFENVLKYLKMSMSSNFGNMMSIALASVFLPFLPMLPVQVLLNDLLYDVSQLTLAGDHVEEVILSRPRRWQIVNIRKFMLVFGPASSVFDLVTFGMLLYVFHAGAALFQTGWFLESIVTQTMIIFVIRTRLVPFYRSPPGRLFALSLIAVIALAILLPFSPLAPYFSFIRPPGVFFVLLTGVIAAYMMMTEAIKQWFYARVDV